MQGEEHITKLTLLDKKKYIYCVHERKTECYKRGIEERSPENF